MIEESSRVEIDRSELVDLHNAIKNREIIIAEQDEIKTRLFEAEFNLDLDKQVICNQNDELEEARQLIIELDKISQSKESEGLYVRVGQWLARQSMKRERDANKDND